MRRKLTRKSARAYLSSLYSRMSKAAAAGARRLRGRANRAGPEHIAEDLAEFDYIEKEAHDILAAVARLRARDMGEFPTPSDLGYTEPPPETFAAPMEYPPETLMEYAPETVASTNMARGRRRRRNAAGGSFHVYSEGGFESGHRSRLAAEKAARAASARRGEMRVIAADVYGMTGPGKGHEVARYIRGRKV